jgi:hypothetical protein
MKRSLLRGLAILGALASPALFPASGGAVGSSSPPAAVAPAANPADVPGPLLVIPLPGPGPCPGGGGCLAGDPSLSAVQVPLDGAAGKCAYGDCGHCVPHAASVLDTTGTSDTWAIPEPVSLHVSDGSDGVHEEGDTIVSFPQVDDNGRRRVDDMTDSATNGNPPFGVDNVHDVMRWDQETNDGNTPVTWGGYIARHTFRQIDKVSPGTWAPGATCTGYTISEHFHWAWWSTVNNHIWTPPPPCPSPSCSFTGLFGDGDPAFGVASLLQQQYGAPGGMGSLPADGVQTFVHIPTCAWLTTTYPQAPTSVDSEARSVTVGDSRGTYDYDVFAEARLSTPGIAWNWGDGVVDLLANDGNDPGARRPVYDPVSQSWPQAQNPCWVSHQYTTVAASRTITATEPFSIPTDTAYWADGQGNYVAIDISPGGPAPVTVGQGGGLPAPWTVSHPVHQIQGVPVFP